MATAGDKPCAIDKKFNEELNVESRNGAAGGDEEHLISKLSLSDIEIKTPIDPEEYCDDDALNLEDPEYLQIFVESVIGPIGLEVHPFLIGWYNERVGPKFQLDYPNDTLAFVVISGPDMFEKCILPYVRLRLVEDPDFSTNEPLDDSMKHAFTILREDLQSEGVEADIFHDFDLHPSRRPKVLVQTAAHVAGAVQYLHKNNLPDKLRMEKFSQKSNLSGVAIHPSYGGWFAIRGVIIFRNHPGGKELKKPDPLRIFNDEQVIARVIELFAYKWQTNEWRDIHNGEDCRYSANFLKYFELETAKRWDFIRAVLLQEDINSTKEEDAIIDTNSI